MYKMNKINLWPLLCIDVYGVTCIKVNLYADANHSGATILVHNFDGCLNLDKVSLWGSDIPYHGGFGAPATSRSAEDIVSSIDTKGNCVLVYRGRDCKEYAGQIKPGSGCHSNWGDSECGFNDEISSISP